MKKAKKTWNCQLSLHMWYICTWKLPLYCLLIDWWMSAQTHVGPSIHTTPLITDIWSYAMIECLEWNKQLVIYKDSWKGHHHPVPFCPIATPLFAHFLNLKFKKHFKYVYFTLIEPHKIQKTEYLQWRKGEKMYLWKRLVWTKIPSVCSSLKLRPS